MHTNYTAFIGYRYDEVAADIKADFPGTVLVITPGEMTDKHVDHNRLQVYVDDMNVITEIMNG